MDDDYDTPWKEVVTYYFSDFMAFFFSDAYAAIDWGWPFDFLDQELAALAQGARPGRRRLDKLVRVRLRGGGEHWMLVHLEVQGRHDSGFAERIFTYHYRMYDRYRRPVASLAVLADSGAHWHPSSFAYDLLGCQLGLVFPIVRLHDYADCMAELLAHPNPFALVTAAHLLAQRSRRKPHQRRRAKWRLTRLLYARGWEVQRGSDMLRVIDSMLYLPATLDARFQAALALLERRLAMSYITSFERAGIRRGWQQGQAQMLLEVLAARFGVVAEPARARVAAARPPQLLAWARRAVSAATLDDVFRD